MLESRHLKVHLKLWDIHYGQQFCYRATVKFPTMRKHLACTGVRPVLGANLRLRHRFPQELRPSQKTSSICFFKCQLYFLTFAFLLCNDCDAAIPPKNILALFMVMKWDGMCVCQDTILSHASQYWQPQLLNSILTTPNMPPPNNMMFLLYIYIYSYTFEFLLKKKQTMKTPNNIPSYSSSNSHCTLHTFSTWRNGKSKHHRRYSACLMLISVLTAMKPTCIAVWDSRTMIPRLVRHGTPLLEQDVAEGTDQQKVARRSQSDVLFPSLHANKQYQN